MDFRRLSKCMHIKYMFINSFLKSFQVNFEYICCLTVMHKILNYLSSYTKEKCLKEIIFSHCDIKSIGQCQILGKFKENSTSEKNFAERNKNEEIEIPTNYRNY